MEVPITKFRHDLFDLVQQAMEGNEVWVRYKGRRFRIAPEGSSGSRISRVTPLQVINPEASPEEPALLEEMTRAWEKDWSAL